MRTRKSRRGNQIKMLASAVGAAAVMLSGYEAKAVDGSGKWNVNASGNWTTTGNWTSLTGGAAYPTGVGQTASLNYNITAARIVTLDTSVTLGALNIGDLVDTPFGFTVNASGGSTFTFDNGGSAATLTKNNASTARASDTINPDILLKDNLSVAVNSLGGGFNLTLGGAISEFAPGKTLTVSGTALDSVLILSNTNNSYSGKITVNSAGLHFASIGDVNGGSNTSLGKPTSVANGTIDLGSGSNDASLTYTGAGTVSTDRVLNFAGTTGGVTLGAAGKITYTQPFTYAGTSQQALTLSGGGTVEILGDITKANLTVTAGTTNSASTSFILSGNNSYIGKTTVRRAGSLVFNSIADWAAVSPAASALGAPTTLADGTITVAPTGSVAVGLKYVGTALLGHSSNRPIEYTSGTGDFTIDASGAGKLTLSGAITRTVAAGSGKQFVLSGTGEAELTSGIGNGSNFGSLSKTGNGRWTLSGTNTYTTATNVSAGTLLINGTHNNAGAYTVTGTGTLGGTGAINTAGNAGVTVSAGAKLSPGKSGDRTLSLDMDSGSLDISAIRDAAAGELLFEIGSLVNYDQIVLTDANSVLNIGASTATNTSLDWSDFSFTALGGLGGWHLYADFHESADCRRPQQRDGLAVRYNRWSRKYTASEWRRYGSATDHRPRAGFRGRSADRWRSHGPPPQEEELSGQRVSKVFASNSGRPLARGAR